jgi:hypothetical protein
MGDILAHDELAMVDYARAARLLLLADEPASRGSIEASAERLACRVFPIRMADGAAWLSDDGSFDGVVLDVTRDNVDVAEPLLDLIVSELDSHCRYLVSAPLDLVDRIAARAWGSDILQVSDPSNAEQTEALEWMLAREPARLHDPGKGTTRLQQLSLEAGRIASALASLSETEAERERGEERPLDGARVRAIIRTRRLRDQFLGPELFADPAWDMLLDLMAARLEGQQVAVSSLCIAAAVPPTTALRWIKALTDQGILLRVADPQDGRRIHIELSEGVANALDAYLRAAHRITADLM